MAVHRGGPLTKDHHHKLIRWARECSEHVLSLIEENIDKRLIHALYDEELYIELINSLNKFYKNNDKQYFQMSHYSLAIKMT